MSIQPIMRGCLATALFLTLTAPCFAQNVDLFSMPGGTVYGQAVGVTAITIGNNPKAKPEIVLFSGLLEITKSHEVQKLSNGLRRMTAQIDSRLGSNEVLGVRSARMSKLGFVQIWVDPDSAHPSTGFLTEVPGTNGRQAEGRFELFLVFQMGPDIGQVRNKQPVILSSHLHQIPPVTPAIKLRKNMTAAELVRIMEKVGDVNSWEGVNLPVALYDKDGVIRAYFTPKLHKTVLTGVCGDNVDNDIDGAINEESPDNIDNDNDGFVDEDCTCPK